MAALDIKRTTDTNHMVEQARSTPAVFVNKFLVEGLGGMVKLTFGEAALTPDEQSRGVAAEDTFHARGALALTIADVQTLYAVLGSVLKDIQVNSES